MKNTAAALLAVARDSARAGKRPSRDIVLAFVADEEDTGRYGNWLFVHDAALRTAVVSNTRS